MTVHVSRPNVGRVRVSTYDRPLHPELFGMLEQGLLRGARMELKMAIEAGGHVLLLTSQGESVTEVVATDSIRLPTRSLQVHQPVRIGHELRADFAGPVRYQFTGHVEVLSPELFAEVSLEYQQDLDRAALVWRGSGHNRLETQPISLLKVTGTLQRVEVHAFHTFPLDCAVLRTQSLFEF